MVVLKEVLTDYKEKYEKAYRLVDEESKNDPPTDPFRSHYSAKDILLEIMENLKNQIASEDSAENQLTFKIILAFVYRDLGRIYAFTEEVPTGEKFLQSCLELVEEHRQTEEAVIPYVGALNELGILHANRQENDKALELLKKSEDIFFRFKAENLNAMAISDIFGTRDEIEDGKGPKELEKLYTLCTFYLAQVLGNLGQLETSARYCHITLQRQLAAKDYDAIDWALNAATLSQYYIGPNRFKDARHHLAAATYIMGEYETNMVTEGLTEEQKEAVKENFSHRFADVARCWSKYGIGLLTASRDRLLNDDDVEKELKQLSVGDSPSQFESLPLSTIEKRVSYQYCLTFDDAKLVFQFVVSWLDKAKQYYRAETEATEYSKIVMDYAELYKLLSFFEEDPSNQSKMHKKRADFLEDLLKLLNPTYYLAICRECWYICGLAYCEMLDIKLDALAKLKINETPTPHMLHKINTLCDKAIKHYKEYLQSYYKKDSEQFQDNIAVEEMQQVLYCHMHIGRLFYKIITPNKTMQLGNLQNSLKYYKRFVETCEERKHASEGMLAEIGVCKEMVHLVPHKIQKLIDDIKEEARD